MRECPYEAFSGRRNLVTMAAPAIELRDVDLSLGEGAARVHILRKVNLTIDKGEAVGLVGPSGSGKSTLLMTMAGLERPDSGAIVVDGVAIQVDGRGRAGAISRRAHRHRLPVLPSDPDHDRAGKRRRAAGARRRARRLRARARRNWRWSASPTANATIPPSSRAASSSASRWRGRWRRGPRC